MGRSWVENVRHQADLLVSETASPIEKLTAANALFDLFAERVGLDDRAPAPAHLEEHVLPAGKAISPQDAARCLRDYARSEKFLRATLAALEKAIRSFADRPVRVLYAGCGPFAPLVLPIAHRFAAEEVRFVLLDYHRRSVEDARRLAESLGVLDRIEAIVQADATGYAPPPESRPHVVVCETMQRALEKEPQVAITRHLGAMLADGGFWIPERVELHLVLTDPGREFAVQGQALSRRRSPLGLVLTLDRSGDRCFDVTWPLEPPGELQPMIFTRIHVLDDIRIDEYESGLTIPTPVGFLTPPRPGGRLRARYRLEPEPGLEIEPA